MNPTCRHCDSIDRLVSARLGYCAPCIWGHFAEVWPEIEKVHQVSRRAETGSPWQGSLFALIKKLANHSHSRWAGKNLTFLNHLADGRSA